jgi:hypothetical protein
MNIEDHLPSFIPSAYHVLTPLDNAFHPNMNNPDQRIMMNRVMSILNDSLDDAQPCKDSFNRNPMQPILFDVLREIKQRNGRENLND